MKAAGGSLYGGIANGLIEGVAESSSRRTAVSMKCRELIRDKPGQNPAGQKRQKHQGTGILVVEWRLQEMLIVANAAEEKAEVFNKHFCSVFGKKEEDAFASHEDEVLSSPLVTKEGTRQSLPQINSRKSGQGDLRAALFILCQSSSPGDGPGRGPTSGGGTSRGSRHGAGVTVSPGMMLESGEFLKGGRGLPQGCPLSLRHWWMPSTVFEALPHPFQRSLRV